MPAHSKQVKIEQQSPAKRGRLPTPPAPPRSSRRKCGNDGADGSSTSDAGSEGHGPLADAGTGKRSESLAREVRDEPAPPGPPAAPTPPHEAQSPDFEGGGSAPAQSPAASPAAAFLDGEAHASPAVDAGDASPTDSPPSPPPAAEAPANPAPGSPDPFDACAMPTGLPSAFYAHFWEFYMHLQIAVADKAWIGNPFHAEAAKAELVTVFTNMVSSAPGVYLPEWTPEMAPAIADWALACWHRDVRANKHRAGELPPSEGVGQSGFWWSSWHLAGVKFAKPEGRFTWLHKEFHEEEPSCSASPAALPPQAASSSGQDDPGDIEALVEAFRSKFNKLRDAVPDVDRDWGDLANAQQEFHDAADQALASLEAAHTEVSNMRRKADAFVDLRVSVQQQVQEWEDRRLVEIQALQDLAQRIPALLETVAMATAAASSNTGAPAQGGQTTEPDRVYLADGTGFLVEVHGKRPRKARDISEAEAGTICVLVHAMLAHGRSVNCVNKELLELQFEGRMLDLRPHIRWARGWCDAVVLANGLRLEVDVLFKILREDRIRTHRWGFSGDGGWIYSCADGTTVQENIRLDLTEDEGKYLQYERMLIGEGVANLHMAPNGAAWLTAAGKDFHREAEQYFGKKFPR